jgi:ABC-type transport system involved in multi-copper enzyme maturation permease subunit
MGSAWAVITRAGVRTLLGKRAFLGLLLFSWFPFFVRAVQIYAAANLPQAAFLTPTPETFRQFLEQQQTFAFFVTVYVGAGLIANDRRANALQIYLSKPLTRAEYVFGKLAILMIFLLFVTWVPAILLLIVQIAFAGNFVFAYVGAVGCYKRGYFDLVKYALLSPAYWVMMSYSGWRAFFQFFSDPFHWEKTRHGLFKSHDS